MATTPGLVTKIRRRFGEFPAFTLLVGAPVDATTNPVTITVTTGEGGKIPANNVRIEWDDGTGETGVVIPQGSDSWLVYRALYGEAMSTHAVGARILISPRSEYNNLSDLISDVVDQFWPTIWIPKETTLTYQSANEYFSPTAADIEQLSYVYQLSGGYRWPLAATYLPLALADDVNFPNGAIQIPYGSTIDSSTIYVAYKAIPTVANLLARQEPLVVDGVVAKKVMWEEAAHLGPAASSTERRVGDGDKLRAGAALWDAFNARLERERIRLLADEMQGAVAWAT